MNFSLLEKIDHTTPGDYDPKLAKLAGLLRKANVAARVAEIFGHEGGGHAIFALDSPSDAVKFQLLVNTIEARIEARREYEAERRAIKDNKEQRKFQPPPDLIEAEATYDRMFEATERYAQEREKVINAELRNSLKKKK